MSCAIVPASARAQDVVELLRAEGVDFGVSEASVDSVRVFLPPVPPPCCHPVRLLVLPYPAPQENGAFYTYLPLSAFDNTDYEIRTPQQWMELLEADAKEAKSSAASGLPARALLRSGDGTGSWHPAKVRVCLCLVWGVCPRHAARLSVWYSTTGDRLR